MSTASRLAGRVILGALPLLAACASGGTRSGGRPEPEVRIQVNNNLLPPRSVTVRVLSAAGSRTLLGVVSAGGTAVLEYEQLGFQGQYVLVAHIDGGPVLQSRPMVLDDGMYLVWTLQANTLLERG